MLILDSKFQIIKGFSEIEIDYDLDDILEGSPLLVDLNWSITSSSLRDESPGFECTSKCSNNFSLESKICSQI